MPTVSFLLFFFKDPEFPYFHVGGICFSENIDCDGIKSLYLQWNNWEGWSGPLWFVATWLQLKGTVAGGVSYLSSFDFMCYLECALISLYNCWILNGWLQKDDLRLESSAPAWAPGWFEGIDPQRWDRAQLKRLEVAVLWKIAAHRNRKNEVLEECFFGRMCLRADFKGECLS